MTLERFFSSRRLSLTLLLLATLAAVHPSGARAQGWANLTNLRFGIEAEDRQGAAEWITDGGQFRLGFGERRVIRTVGDDPRNSSSRLFPPATFRIVSGDDAATLRDAHPKTGTVMVEATRQAGRSQVVRIEWQLGDGVTTADGRTRGFVEAVLPGVATSPSWAGDTTARSIVRDLYRGILVREPDQGGRHWEELIETKGYDGVVEAARDIANSTESQRDIYGRGVSNQQRLAAMYEHLQGRPQSQVPMHEWNENLDALDRRHYEYVTLTILWGDPFFSRHEVVRPRDHRGPGRPRP